jgi:hypothetical protein
MKASDKIRRLLAKGLSAIEIAKRLKVEASYVHTIKWLDKKAKAKQKVQVERSHDPKVVKAEKKYLKAVKTKKPSKIVKAVKEMKQALDVIEKPKITRKELLDELMPGINACFGLDEKPTKLFVQPQHEYAAMKILADNDLVNHPPHYKSGGIETIDFIEAKDLNYRLGNVVKYVVRAGKKATDPVQDLEKAAWYLQREITARKNA